LNRTILAVLLLGLPFAASAMVVTGQWGRGLASGFEALWVTGRSLDGVGYAVTERSVSRRCMLITDNHECTGDLFKSIPSPNYPGKTVLDETVEFSGKQKANSMARLVDKHRAKAPVASMRFSMPDRIKLLGLSKTGEDTLDATRNTDWLSSATSSPSFATETQVGSDHAS
jgi:oleate hydratase